MVMNVLTKEKKNRDQQKTSSLVYTQETGYQSPASELANNFSFI